MKRPWFFKIGVVVLICAQLLSVVGCKPKEAQKFSKEMPTPTNQGELIPTNELIKGTIMTLSSLPQKYISDNHYKDFTYTPQVNQVTVAEDFSNIINFNQFEGFTPTQLQMLKQNGFVVMQPRLEYPYLKLHQVYEEGQYTKTPLFITTDAVFNLYHIFYNESLKGLEASQLSEALDQFTDTMLKASLDTYEKAEYANIKDQLMKITAYYGVAKRLLGNSTQLPNEIENLVDHEVRLISSASEVTFSPIVGTKQDYTQYKVRGHYTNTERLTAYFKAMMWYGQIGFEMIDSTNRFNLENTQLSLIMSMMILSSKEAVANWDRIYTATNIYVGAADDLTLYDLKPIISKVYGEKVGLLSVLDKGKEVALEKEIRGLRSPEIRGKFVLTDDIATNIQFRVMGQRYTLDGDIMQKLMEPILRPVPSGLDVTAALGSERSKELVLTYDKPHEKWESYLSILEELQMKCKGLSAQDWGANLYSGWLSAIASTTKSFETTEGMPSFMRSQAWTDKSIHTALGSYAELKHDTVLYSKQPVAEMGGPPENMPYIYVEPQIEVYMKLLNLTENTIASLSSRELLRPEAKEVLERIKTYLTIILNCSKKELTNERFTAEEYEGLSSFGGMVDSVSTQLASMNMAIDETTTESYTSALISDVATILNGPNYLELGSGLPYEIYVICPYQGKLFLAKGATFSYYEFLSDTRLTDEEWHKLLGIQKSIDAEYGFESITATAPTDGLNDLVPKWTKTFISSEPNEVDTTSVEVIWDDAMLPNNPTPGPDGQYDY